MFRYPLNSQEIFLKKRALKKQLLQAEGLLQKRVALLSGTTIGEIKNILELFLLDFGIKPEFFEGEFGRYYEDIVFDNPALLSFSPEMIYIHTGIHNIDSLPAAGDDAETVKTKLSAEWNKIFRLLEGAKRFNCPVIINNFELPVLRVMGNREAYDVSGKIRFINSLNGRLADFAEESESFYLQDINYLSAWYGLERWGDPTYYYSYKYGLNPDAIPLLCLSVAAIMKAILGKNKKVLMTDLDNTLWGGVIGDDGIDGITLGLETPLGTAHSDLQKYMLELRHTGILLGVVSKNEPAAAESGLSHPSSILKKNDFSAFYANWEPKDQNLKHAAEALNIGSDFFVFVDDNPVEREFVEHAGLGIEVASFDSPEKVAINLSMSGYFEAVSLSADDRRRAEMYLENVSREAEESSYSDYSDYLRALDMRVFFSSFSKEKQQRIAQLINKTNQFNLTTRRYSSEEIASIENDPDKIKIVARLTDKFGDNGIVSILIAKKDGDNCIIELFIMSCRVFRRDLEFAMFDELIRHSQEMGISTITGYFFPTAKNAVVKDFYSSLGFQLIETFENKRRYKFAISDHNRKNETIEVFYE